MTDPGINAIRRETLGPVTPIPDGILRLARLAHRITVLTGAGMSADSGVPTFRDAQTGLWSLVDPQDLATPEAWRRDKPYVNAWFLWRVHLMSAAAPNAGHHALAAWGRRPDTDLRIVTQNIDDLHERAGSTVLAQLHGSLFAWRCGRWVFTMIGPDGTSYPNESRFTSIEADRKVVIRHVAEPHFTLTITLESSPGGTLLRWDQALDDPAVAQALRHIIEPANEQNLDRLGAELENA